MLAGQSERVTIGAALLVRRGQDRQPHPTVARSIAWMPTSAPGQERHPARGLVSLGRARDPCEERVGKRTESPGSCATERENY